MNRWLLRVLNGVGMLLVVAFVVVRLYPFVWLFLSSMRDNAAIFTNPWGLPKSLEFQQFREVWVEGGLGVYLLNSLAVTSGTIIGVLVVSSLAAYGFARLRFPLQRPLFSTFLLGLIIPIQSFIIPLYVLFRQIGLLNSRLGLVVAYVAWSLPLSIFVLHAFFATLPKGLEEAAAIDGCNPFQTFVRVILPISKPALATVGTFAAITAWNELLLAMLFIRDSSKSTLSAGMLLFQGHYDINYKMLFSGLTIVVLPLLIVYVFFNRHVIEGLTVGAVKE